MLQEFIQTFKANLDSELDMSISVTDSAKVADVFIETLLKITRSSSDALTFKKQISFRRVLRKSRVFVLPDKKEHTKDAHYVLSMTVSPETKKKFEDKKVILPTIKQVNRHDSVQHQRQHKHHQPAVKSDRKRETPEQIISELREKIVKKKIVPKHAPSADVDDDEDEEFRLSMKKRVAHHKKATSAWRNDDSDDEV